MHATRSPTTLSANSGTAPQPAVGQVPTNETTLLWSSGEGQIVNAWVFLWAILLFWTVFAVGYAACRFVLTARRRYELTDQRLLVYSGLIVRKVDSLELYRMKDISVGGTVLQGLTGRGQITIISSDASTSELLIDAVADPQAVAQLIRDTAEACRNARGVRAFDY